MNRIVRTAALLALAPATAFAHAHLKSSQPVADSTVKAPVEVVIDFTEGVEPRFSTIEVLDPAGSHLESGAVHTAPADNKHLSVTVKPLQPGTYTVRWHATATDTHKTEGEFRFTVGGAPGG